MAMPGARITYYAALLLLVAITSAGSTKCSRLIDGVTRPRSIAEGKYHFSMTLFNRTDTVNEYMPSTRYSVILEADNRDQITPRKFTRFFISAEAENMNETADVGVFDLQEDTLTTFAENCANAVVETSKVHKDKISVTWTSPSEDSGCIFLRATVVETPDTWYMDDDKLEMRMCQDSKAEADDQGPVLSECCACEEAKYEVTFEGLWSRNTHPKDFPSKGWTIRFSDVIGASHTGDYHFWQYNGNATIGLQQVAELGATRKLESELKAQSEHIRTIIKARGISYPNVTGKTFAVFRVDRKHHLMSLVSMINPSPDWIVGVSGLELCLPNCSWIVHKELNLYPYDVGTDNGITYTSDDSVTEPKEPIRRITSTYPNDSRSPFYEPSGLDMKPLAKLYLNRQRLYDKTCDSAGDSDEAEACQTTSWGQWTTCSVTCGRSIQLRQRHFLDPVAADQNKCNNSITDRRHCYNMQVPSCPGNSRHDGILQTDKCELSEWGSWSSCSSTCGEGSRTRSRKFRLKNFRKQCMAVPNGPPLQRTVDCENDPCEDEDEEVSEGANQMQERDIDYLAERADATGEMMQEWLQKCPAERYTKWAIWSPCSSSCGPGVKVRSRLLKDSIGSGKYWSRPIHGVRPAKDSDGESHEDCKTQQASCVAEIPSCNFSKEEAEKICSEPMERGNCNANIIRAYFDKQTGSCHMFSYSGCNGNRNNFPTEQDCYYVCGTFQKADFKGFQSSSQIMESSEDDKVDCQVSEWSKWSHCENCRGYTVSTRNVMVVAKDGGKSCPRKLFRKKKCHRTQRCSPQAGGTNRRYHRGRNTENEHEISVDCEVTKWSAWSKCSATCGEALRTRVRSMIIQPRGPWAKLCPALAEFKKCPRIDCPQ